MVYPRYSNLNPQKALIWRIVHFNNLPWILENGLYCTNSTILDPNYITIGHPSLIDKRRHRIVPIAPYGTLADYIPFYFTPFSMMLMNIHSGYGVKKCSNEEIVILVSGLHHLKTFGKAFLFTDAHAYLNYTNYYDDLDCLDKIDWDILQRRDFKRDKDDPKKTDRYQAEALVYEHLPTQGLIGIICYNEEQEQRISEAIKGLQLNLNAYARPEWYFK